MQYNHYSTTTMHTFGQKYNNKDCFAATDELYQCWEGFNESEGRFLIRQPLQMSRTTRQLDAGV
jgi:hypothetical protein